MSGRIVRAGSKKSKPVKPEKPYPTFPLFSHASGKWAKKVRGRMHYFGEWADPEGALNEWLAVKDYLIAGRDPKEAIGYDINDLVHDFLDSKQQQHRHGELTLAGLNDYQKAGQMIANFFGKARLVATLDTPDFSRLRSNFPESWAPATVNNQIARISAIFNFAYDEGKVDRPIRKGKNFKRVSRKRQRLERAKKPKRLFDAVELHRLIGAADFQLKAMILLGINCGYGNADCGRLEIPTIDFKRSWIEDLRQKTAVERAAWLWPETIQALQHAIDNRYSSAPASLAERVFVTKRRQSWYKENGKSDPISVAFRKLTEKVGCRREGIGFYSLRHTFETIAGNSRDQIAVNYVMGHSDESMAQVYREGIDPKRIIAACSFVRRWFLRGRWPLVRMKMPKNVRRIQFNEQTA
ncbi:hypothetical protein CKO51_25420 [Rhodopirellula sp. SM50]|nr:tyrosine-type recombinase/integrase [Rhodopirellula sp. SM50]PAY16653.1 hypothetical protein CKO51_25420 [Rhodopirellula sp. SM50]